MGRWLIVVASLVAAVAAADEFTNKKTGAAVQGRLLGKVSLDGAPFFLVKTAKGMKRLPVAEWVHSVATPRGTPATPAPTTGTAPGTATPARPASTWTPTEYRGKTRSVPWLRKAYGLASRQVLCYDGRYYNTYEVNPVGSAKRGPGQVFAAAGKAIRVLGNGQVLATMSNGQRVAIEGMTLLGVVGGREWKAYLAGVEVYEDDTASGAERKVLRCRRLEPPGSGLTREEFLKMLEAGVRIYSRQTCPMCKGTGTMMVDSHAVSGARHKRRCKMCKGRKTVLMDLADGKVRD